MEILIHPNYFFGVFIIYQALILLCDVYYSVTAVPSSCLRFLGIVSIYILLYSYFRPIFILHTRVWRCDGETRETAK